MGLYLDWFLDSCTGATVVVAQQKNRGQQPTAWRCTLGVLEKNSRARAGAGRRSRSCCAVISESSSYMDKMSTIVPIDSIIKFTDFFAQVAFLP